MHWNKVLFYVLCAVKFSDLAIAGVSAHTNKVFDVSLKEDNSIRLYWQLDYSSETVTFEVHIPAGYGWFALGFSDRGDPFPADYCVLWENVNGIVSFDDAYADNRGVLHLDKQQDCRKFKIKTSSNFVKYTYRRKFDTCDNNDYVVEDGTTHIVWSRGKHKLYQLNGLNVSSSTQDIGMVRVHLLKNTHVEAALPKYVRNLDIVTNKVKVPNVETTYWCHVFKLPDEFSKKHHIYQYESHIQDNSRGVVHHMEVFHCETGTKEEIPLYIGDCFAKDRPPKTQEASLPIGGENFNPYIMLEIHYNNPELRSDIVDSSGIRFHVSSKLKKMDAGVIELGLEYTDKMAIPPGQEQFRLTGYCTSVCTSMGLPSEGITIFGSQLHTHLTGARVVTRHFDAYGKELPELNRDNHYSTHFQEIRRLKKPVKVLPGHVLITRCDYNTEDRPNITMGGFSISDEMCVNYIHYFPHTELEVCKSSISDQALKTYFQYMNEWEGQSTSPSKGVSDNYKAIQWNKIRVQLLQEVYQEALLSMQCNMSSGDRFPGYWENAQIPPVLLPLPPPVRKCEHIAQNDYL
ncbi:unnamed protein product [Acanthoscelides obtectus]|uniref:DOMON domain-containing protein n=2 Tax=Acanthoscelides obtectus TaxID=200917 RepID=A0A9P0P4D8_ACAOB|nr:unnamed protein product [Acanthoscelides obtectus]CAK1631177.1 Tyramine beta-hydroxylase [Acanthoscelides obtectus]